jgi:hypothetical protein
VTYNGEVVVVPQNKHGIILEKIASYIYIRTGLGFTLKWDTNDAVFVDVDERFVPYRNVPYTDRWSSWQFGG